jgi:hypothetical protein
VGWSQTFVYATGANPTATVLGTSENQFAVTVPVPEPTTMALGALGGIALLAFRRKKA